MSEPDIIVRALQLTDISGAMRLKNAENWNQTEQDWEMLMQHNPDLCFVAAHDGKVVGTVTATNYDNEIAWIGMMLVDRAYRGLGLGKRLLTTVMQELASCRFVGLDATDQGQPLYEKLGFREESLVDRMVAPALVISATPPNSTHPVMPLVEAQVPQVTELDRAAFGADRSRLFAEFLKNNRDKAWYLEKEGKLAGYVLGRNGARYTQIGPLSAETTEDAETLVLAAARHYAGQPVVLDIIRDKRELQASLIALGFTVQRSFVRMYLSPPAAPIAPGRYFLIAGPELG